MSLSSVKVHVKVHCQGRRSCSCEMLNIAICQNWWNTIDEFSPFHACTCCCAEGIDRKIQTAFMKLCRFSDEHLPQFKHIYRTFKSINNLSTKTKLGWTLFLSRNNSTAIAITYKTLWCVVYLLNIFKRCAVFWQFHCRVLNRNSKLFVFYFMQLDNNSFNFLSRYSCHVTVYVSLILLSNSIYLSFCFLIVFICHF